MKIKVHKIKKPKILHRTLWQTTYKIRIKTTISEICKTFTVKVINNQINNNLNIGMIKIKIKIKDQIIIRKIKRVQINSQEMVEKCLIWRKNHLKC